MALLKVRDECTKLVGHRFLNSHICLCIALVQLLVCCWAVAQHANSYLVYHKILKCDFLEGSLPLEAVDAVIFDIRLFHYLWGIRGCVAEYLDGGFGRLAWCISHSTSLLFSLPVTFISHPRPCYFWPLLVQQSAYGVCLLILLLAALPRIVVVLAAPHAAPLVPILFYFLGTSLNFFHLYVYWHWYWHVSSRWNSAVRVKFGGRLLNANNRSRKDKPRTAEVIDDAVLHYVPNTSTTYIAASDVATNVSNGHVIRENATMPAIVVEPSPSDETPATRGGDDVDADDDDDGGGGRAMLRRSVTAVSRRPILADATREPTRVPSDKRRHRRRRRVSIVEVVDDVDVNPPPIYATRLYHFSAENSGGVRRKLPPTPDEPMHGELPVFCLPKSHL